MQKHPFVSVANRPDLLSCTAKASVGTNRQRERSADTGHKALSEHGKGQSRPQVPATLQTWAPTAPLRAHAPILQVCISAWKKPDKRTHPNTQGTAQRCFALGFGCALTQRAWTENEALSGAAQVAVSSHRHRSEPARGAGPARCGAPQAAEAVAVYKRRLPARHNLCLDIDKPGQKDRERTVKHTLEKTMTRVSARTAGALRAERGRPPPPGGPCCEPVRNAETKATFRALGPALSAPEAPAGTPVPPRCSSPALAP